MKKVKSRHQSVWPSFLTLSKAKQWGLLKYNYVQKGESLGRIYYIVIICYIDPLAICYYAQRGRVWEGGQ